MTSLPHRRAVFLDRDGVLIAAVIRGGRPYAAASPDEVEILPGVPEACASLSGLGFVLVMFTNQPEIARGGVGRDFVEATNRQLAERLHLDRVEMCAHDNADACECRKPNPGMILQAAEALGIDITGSFVVGDRWRDVEAGRRAGCTTILVDGGHDEPLIQPPDHKAPSLAAAAEWIGGQILQPKGQQ